MLTIKGIYGREMYETWYKMTVMLESGLDIKPVITHRFAWHEYEKGFAAMKSGDSGKVILDWRESQLTLIGDDRSGRKCLKSQDRSTNRSLREIRGAGLYKSERILASPQNARVDLPAEKAVLNLCANNYLGLADHPEVITAAHEALDRWGYGLSSVRFICGTQEIHKELERRLSEFLGMEDTILYSSCFDANGGLFETLLDAEDAIVSDELNHASIIDGIRLSKAQRFRYRNGDMEDLEAKLKEASSARRHSDRHRRRVFDGRLHRQAAGDLRSGRTIQSDGHGG